MTRDRAYGSRFSFEAPVASRLRRAARRALAVALLAAPLASCTAGHTAGTSSSFLIIDRLQGASGAQPEDFSTVLASDVRTGGGFREDIGQVQFRLAMKDPGSIETPLAPTSNNFITVTRYRVRYVRSDGRSTPGVDVPYPFDGAMTATVTDEGGLGTLVLVRIQAKLESPLLALHQLGSEIAITTIAEVTFFGKDQAGREVSVTGHIGVTFADWADPQ
jgi:hypothetical protein